MPWTAACEFVANSLLRTCKIPSGLVSSQRRGNSRSSFSRLLWQLVRKVGDRYRNSVYPCLFHSLSAITVNVLGFVTPFSETRPCNWLIVAESLVLVGLNSQSTKTEFQRAQRYFIYRYNLSVTVTVKIKVNLQHYYPSSHPETLFWKMTKIFQSSRDNGIRFVSQDFNQVKIKSVSN